MTPDTAYYRTRQHTEPAGVPASSTMEQHGWGLMCSNFRAMRIASAEQHFENSGFVRRTSSLSRVELLTFQMALGLVGAEDKECARFHDLVATGFVREGERKAVLMNWCDTGAIPEGFKLAGRVLLAA